MTSSAATLWFVTVMGLCFGGGQIGLGLASCGIGLIVLAGLKQLEQGCKEERHATLVLSVTSEGPNERELASKLESHGFRIKRCGLSYEPAIGNREITCELRWRSTPHETLPPPFLKELAATLGVLRVEWKP